MRHHVAGHDQPGAVALFVEPKLAVVSGGVVPQVEVVVEVVDRVGGLLVGLVNQVAATEIGELLRIPRAEKGMVDDHSGVPWRDRAALG